MPWTPEEIRRSREAIASAIRDAGGEVLPNGNCRCPFHDDANPSASIKLLDKGHWHFHCYPCNWGGDVYAVIQRHRGCTFPEAKEAAMALVGELTPEPVKQQKPVHTYPTIDAAVAAVVSQIGRDHPGARLGKVYRYTDAYHRVRVEWIEDGKPEKTFRECSHNGKGWVQRKPPGKTPLYRVAELPATGPIAVCEGEKACDAAWSIGIAATTSGGSNSAPNADWAPLAGRVVVVFPDNDPPGAKYAEEVAGILRSLSPPARVKVVRLPGLPAKGDLVQFLEARQ